MSQADDKRDKILKAAIRVFADKGFHEAKVDEIAKLADVGKGTVYEYFTSKTELFQEMCKSGMRFYSDQITKQILPNMSCRERLTMMAKIHSEFMIKNQSLAKIIFNENTYFDHDFRQWICQNRQRKIDIIADIVATGIEDGEFKKVNPVAAALNFLGLTGGWMHLVFVAEYKGDLEKIMDDMLEVHFEGLAK